MKQIKLSICTARNFCSFVDMTTVVLAGGPGLKLINGRNEAEPRLGANGAGKSTLWDAVCWASRDLDPVVCGLLSWSVMAKTRRQAGLN